MCVGFWAIYCVAFRRRVTWLVYKIGWSITCMKHPTYYKYTVAQKKSSIRVFWLGLHVTLYCFGFLCRFQHWPLHFKCSDRQKWQFCFVCNSSLSNGCAQTPKLYLICNNVFMQLNKPHICIYLSSESYRNDETTLTDTGFVFCPRWFVRTHDTFGGHYVIAKDVKHFEATAVFLCTRDNSRKNFRLEGMYVTG